MSNTWIGKESKDRAAPSLRKVRQYLTPGRILELKSTEEATIRAKQVPSRHANAKAEGFVLGVLLASSPDSELTDKIHVSSEMFIARSFWAV